MDWKENWNRCFGNNEDGDPVDTARGVEPLTPNENSVNTVNCVNRPSECISGDSEDLENLAEYLVEDIRSGGAYARLFLNVRGYLRRELASYQFDQVEKAFLESRDTATMHTEPPGTEGSSYPDELGRVKCTHCWNLTGVRCLKLHEPDGIYLLRDCDDFRGKEQGEQDEQMAPTAQPSNNVTRLA